MRYLHLWKCLSSGVITSDGYCNSEFETQEDALEILQESQGNQRYYQYFATITFFEGGKIATEDWSGILNEWKMCRLLDAAHFQYIKDYYMSTR